MYVDMYVIFYLIIHIYVYMYIYIYIYVYMCISPLHDTQEGIAGVVAVGGANGSKSEGGKDPRSLMVQLHQHFRYQDHVCLVFEALGVNLLQLLQVRPHRSCIYEYLHMYRCTCIEMLFQLHQHFRYQDHVCLVFEALGVNLLQLLQVRQHRSCIYVYLLVYRYTCIEMLFQLHQHFRYQDHVCL